MLRADLGSFPSLPAALGSMPAIGAPIGGQTAGLGYNPLAQSVAQDVQQFIAQGSATTPAMSAHQASWLALQARQRLPSTSTSTDAAVPAVDDSEPVDIPRGAALKPAQQAFLQRIGPWAQQAALRLGVSVRSVLAHAALESAWGQRPVRGEAGEDSLNLFGIKAGSTWAGGRVQALTTEYAQGLPVRQQEAFRSYEDLDATFADYVRLLEHSPRYRTALQTREDVAAFARGLAQGGYATDPEYARKLLNVSRSIPARP